MKICICVFINSILHLFINGQFKQSSYRDTWWLTEDCSLGYTMISTYFRLTITQSTTTAAATITNWTVS